MRKLSKKISMLMVLAMLVSLFSGVVSASAASSWSFYNKTTDEIVAVKETIEMESNEFADFDLYKDGKTIDTDVYTVKYESSDADVVFVDAKNGKLRADKAGVAEAGDKAMITAVITNKTTNITARRSFYIEIAEDAVEYEIVANFGDEAFVVGEKYDLAAVVTADGEAVEAEVVFAIDGKAVETYAPAAAGEVVIVATATIDGEEYTAEFVCDVVEAEKAFELKQVSMTTVNVAFATEAAADAFVKNYDGKLAVSYTLKDSEDVIDDIASVKEVKLSDDKTVAQIVMFNNFVSDATYTIAFDGEEDTFVGAGVVPADIVVVEKGYAYETTGKLEINVYNADGVLINGGYNTDVYTTSWEVVNGDENKYYISGNEITFFEKDVKVIVKATLDMGYDENDVELADFTDEGAVKSIDKISDSRITGFSFNSGYGYGNTLNMFAKEQKKFYAAFKRTDLASGVTSDKEIFNGTVAGTTEEYKYTSSNPTVAMVDETTGLVTANTAGTATIFVKNSAGATIGSVAIKVEGKKKIATFDLAPNKNKLSIDDVPLADEDSIELTITAKDQFGNDLAIPGDLNGGDFTYEMSNVDSVADLFDIQIVGNKIVIKQATGATADDLVPAGDEKTATYRLTVKAQDNSSYVTLPEYFSFTVKNVNTAKAKVANIELDMKTSVDMLAIKDYDKGLDDVTDYDVTIKAKKLDSAGFFLGYEEIDTLLTTVATTASVSTGDGQFTVVVTENNQAVKSEYRGLFTTVDSKTLKFTPVTEPTNAITKFKADGSTFAVRLYEGKGTNGLKTWNSKTLKITDSSAAPYAKQLKSTIDGVVGTTVDSENLFKALELYYAGKKLSADNTVVDDVTLTIKDTTVGDKTQYFIYDVTVKAIVSKFNSAYGNTSAYESVKIPVNKLFVAE